MKSTTLSFHNGSGKNNISNRTNLIAVQKHNARDSKENVVLIGTNNIYKDMQKYYEETFAEAVAKYNATQKRKDRRIDNYFDKVADDKKSNLGYEAIFQIGDKDFWDNADDEDYEVLQETYLAMIDTFKSVHPGITVVNATLHFDEASPHCHVVYAVAQEYEKGLSLRSSRAGVFTSERMSKLHEELHDCVDDLGHFDIEIKRSDEEKFDHMDIPTYKKLRKSIGNMKREYIELYENNSSLKRDNRRLEKRSEEFSQRLNQVETSIDDFEEESKEKLKIFSDKMNENIVIEESAFVEVVRKAYPSVYEEFKHYHANNIRHGNREFVKSSLSDLRNKSNQISRQVEDLIVHDKENDDDLSY